jgi:hypothetical protein
MIVVLVTLNLMGLMRGMVVVGCISVVIMVERVYLY